MEIKAFDPLFLMLFFSRMYEIFEYNLYRFPSCYPGNFLLQ